MSSEIQQRIGAMPNGMATLCDTVNVLHKAGVYERLRAPAACFAGGRYRMILMPTSWTAVDPSLHKPTVNDGTYVVHSQDEGKTWHLLDLTCINERWVRQVFPPYAGKPEIYATDLQRLGQSS